MDWRDGPTCATPACCSTRSALAWSPRANLRRCRRGPRPAPGAARRHRPDDGADMSEFVVFVLESVCDFTPGAREAWLRGSAVPSEWCRRALTGETVKPRQLWSGPHGAVLPVFLDARSGSASAAGGKTASQVVQWLRAGRRAAGAAHQRPPVAAGASPASTSTPGASGTSTSGSRRAARRRRSRRSAPCRRRRSGRRPREGEPAPLLGRHPRQPQGPGRAVGRARRAGARGRRAARPGARRGARAGRRCARPRRPGRHLPRRRAHRHAPGGGAVRRVARAAAARQRRSTTAPTA